MSESALSIHTAFGALVTGNPGSRRFSGSLLYRRGKVEITALKNRHHRHAVRRLVASLPLVELTGECQQLSGLNHRQIGLQPKFIGSQVRYLVQQEPPSRRHRPSERLRSGFVVS